MHTWAPSRHPSCAFERAVLTRRVPCARGCPRRVLARADGTRPGTARAHGTRRGTARAHGTARRVPCAHRWHTSGAPCARMAPDGCPPACTDGARRGQTRSPGTRTALFTSFFSLFEVICSLKIVNLRYSSRDKLIFFFFDNCLYALPYFRWEFVGYSSYSCFFEYSERKFEEPLFIRFSVFHLVSIFTT